MYIYIVYIQFLFIILNLHMSKKSSTFAAAKVKQERKIENKHRRCIHNR